MAIADGVLTNLLVLLGGVFLMARGLPFLARWPSYARQAAIGLMFGLMIVASMLNAFPIGPGIFGDLRNAIIAVAAITVGPTAAIFSTAVAVAFRTALGGHVAGAVVGLLLCTAFSLVFTATKWKHDGVRLAGFGATLALINAAAPFLGLASATTNLDTVLPISAVILTSGLLLYPLVIPGMTLLLKHEMVRLEDRANLLAKNEELSIQERRYRDVFDLSCVPMAWVDLDSRRFIRTNEEYQRFTGYGASELLHMTVDQLSIPENREEDVATLSSLSRGETASVNGERRYLTKEGAIRWGNRTLTVAPATDGQHLGLAIVQDITERKRSAEQIAFLAEHDPLTTLANRFSFTRTLEAATEAPGRQPFAVLLFDLDDFKAVNDTRGHGVGDELLVNVASALQSTVHSGDVVARLGGDEFALMCPNISSDRVIALAERVIHLIDRSCIIGGEVMPVSASAGIAIYPADATDPAELLKKADIALYASKADGKGKARLFDSSMEDQIVRKEQLRSELGVALSRGQFELEYQPLIDIESSSICGFEALLRWNHPSRGRVSPAEFIPILEEGPSITALGAWALREACTAAATWPEDVDVAVNVSVRQFEPALPLTVAAALSSSGLQAHRLQLEITESVLMDGADDAIEILKQLRRLGVKISLDDFGTGFSSLSYLQKFPFDKLKIDKSFVSEAVTSEESRKITKAIVQLGRSLGMRITAEGIETTAQLERMRAKGCDEAQGYLFSPSVPFAAVPLLLQRFSPTFTAQRRLGA